MGSVPDNFMSKSAQQAQEYPLGAIDVPNLSWTLPCSASTIRAAAHAAHSRMFRHLDAESARYRGRVLLLARRSHGSAGEMQAV